jgi:hypothetical protein
MGNIVNTPRQAPRTLAARVRNSMVAAAVTVMAVGPALAADATTPEQGIADAIAKILLIIVAGGGGLITLSLAGVGWRVGAKWIKSLKSGA